ncbi:sensor histidine kinase [Peristeroidobacter soli]|jgi:PAS domain S-box-containing protein|uniref:sensor histidine kinase n=1 Tax=Peristeroidobacter soli TaxID=2497877 RepID=UPI00101D6F37|nr:ATP-binding protein [Peristeroidobacter soli]
MVAGEGKFADAAGASGLIEHESSSRGVRPLVKVWAVVLVLHTGVIASGLISGAIATIVNDVLWTVAASAAAISSFRAAFSLHGRNRVAWLLFAFACSAWTAGQIVWDILELYFNVAAPFPSYADIGYLLFGPLMLIGLFVLRATQQERRMTWLRVANIGLILCSLTSVLITTLARPFEKMPGTLGDALVVVIENGTIAIAFIVAVYFLWSYRWSDRLLAYGLVTLSLGAQMVTGMLYTRALIGDSYNTASFFSAGWMLAFALHQWGAEAQVSAKTHGRAESLAVRQSQGWVEALVPSLLLMWVGISAIYLAGEVSARTVHLRTLVLVAFAVILASREAWLYWQGQQLRSALDNSASSLTRARERLQDIDSQRRDLERLIDVTARAGRVGLWEWEPATNVVHYSREWKRQIGYAEDEIPDEFAEWSKRLHPADYAKIMGMVERFLRHPAGELIIEHRLRHRDGSYRWMLAQGSSLLDADGRPWRVAGSLVDITPFKELEESLRESERRYRELADALECRVAQRTRELSDAYRESRNFAHAVAHDLKAPLRAINGFCALLEQSAANKLSETEHSYLERARQGSIRLSGLIDDLLDYSRLEHREQRLQPIDCRAFVRGLVDSMSERIEEAHAQVHIDLDTTPVLADSEGLRIALTNLIENALKFSRQTAQPRISIESSLEYGRYLLKVRDNGIGFDVAYRDKIFEIFNRLHASGYEGTGIGLALVRKAVQRMEGEVWAESVPGEGATFSLSLKLADASETAPVSRA